MQRGTCCVLCAVSVVVVVFARACVRVSAGGPAQMSSYVGVSWVRDTKKWEARIRQAGAPQQRLGYFLTEEEAARAFDDAARRLRGDAAHGGRSGPTAARFRCALSSIGYKRLRTHRQKRIRDGGL